MCGRYSFSVKRDTVAAQLTGIYLERAPVISYNIAPTQLAYVVTDAAPGIVQQFHWGLVPFWAKDVKIGARLINARSETLWEKPAFREAAQRRHCWVLADSFYEWKVVGGERQPYRIQLQDESIMIMAGIWETWRLTEGQDPWHSFAIITCPSNREMREIHSRMPVILRGETARAWLAAETPAVTQQLLQVPADGLLKMYPVSSRVNAVRNNDAGLHIRVGEQGSLF